LQAAVEAFLAMTPEQQQHAHEMHELGCTGHSLNLTVDDCWAKSETTTLTVNMVRHRAELVLKRNLLGFLKKILCKKLSKPGARGQILTERSLQFSRLVFKGYVGSEPAFSAGFKVGKAPTLSLVPAGFHLDGRSEVPDVQAITRSAAKAFATGGDDSSYYLNEKRQFHAFAKLKSLRVFSLPSVKGSRQSINVQLPTALLRNCSAYLEYMDAVRVDSDPNLLITSLSIGLKDRFVQSALRARSFIDVAFTTPMTFFTHVKSVKRTQIRGVMDCAAVFIEQIASIGFWTPRLVPFPIDFIAKLILVKYPALQAELV